MTKQTILYGVVKWEHLSSHMTAAFMGNIVVLPCALLLTFPERPNAKILPQHILTDLYASFLIHRRRFVGLERDRTGRRATPVEIREDGIWMKLHFKRPQES